MAMSRQTSLRTLSFLGATALAVAAPAPASGGSIDFRTPKRAAYCDYTPKGEIIEGGVPARTPMFQCWTPNDGFTVHMKPWGRADKLSADQLEGAYPRTARLLRFGQTWRRNGIRCRSRRSGLTCRNRDGHGWWLGRFVGYRVF